MAKATILLNKEELSEAITRYLEEQDWLPPAMEVTAVQPSVDHDHFLDDGVEISCEPSK